VATAYGASGGTVAVVSTATGLPIGLGPFDPLVADVRRRLQGQLIQTLAGDADGARNRTPPTSGDTGWFGPDSVTWRLHQDTSLLLGGVRSLMLQTMEPRTMTGVAQHSNYKADPLGRLWRTGAYVGAVTFGTTAEAEAAIRMVNRAHRPVHGTAADGRSYDANDAHLKLWVHMGMVDSFLTAYRRYGKERLSLDDTNRYLREMAFLADKLGAGRAPETRDELKDYFATLRREGQLWATPEARETVKWLLSVRVSAVTRAPYAVIAAAALNSLPAWVRLQLRMPILPVSDRLAVRPAATLLLRTFSWAMTAEAAEAAAP
jgi:uncharacterized protein (DUF2236 family)